MADILKPKVAKAVQASVVEPGAAMTVRCTSTAVKSRQPVAKLLLVLAEAVAMSPYSLRMHQEFCVVVFMFMLPSLPHRVAKKALE